MRAHCENNQTEQKEQEQKPAEEQKSEQQPTFNPMEMMG
jgi:hypothetical protein